MSNRGQPKRGYIHAEADALSSDNTGQRAASGPISSKENCTLLEDLAILVDTDQPVTLETFRRRSSTGRGSVDNIKTPLYSQLRPSGDEAAPGSRTSEDRGDKEYDGYSDVDDKALDTELLEAYIDSTYNQERSSVQEHSHFWTKYIGTRYSKRRGCTQFWAWLLIGVGVLLWLGISLSSLELNELLHLDAFTVKNVQVTEDFTFLHFLEEVDFHLTYTVETPNPATSTNANSSYFNALLLNEYEYEHYVDGEPFEYISAGSKIRTTNNVLRRAAMLFGAKSDGRLLQY
ncbi:hypothetical protein GN958_ATG11880 [Phytophthora infestans]|uniref:Transmembrane protein n=1 Tax=Phytophthora infestans TaxID=4787 RepID=A0A8S9UEH6_PHYIN|nr:hypothetical protein GN958_ATG11880 [Phytophthora infestans]